MLNPSSHTATIIQLLSSLQDAHSLRRTVSDLRLERSSLKSTISRQQIRTFELVCQAHHTMCTHAKPLTSPHQTCTDCRCHRVACSTSTRACAYSTTRASGSCLPPSIYLHPLCATATCHHIMCGALTNDESAHTPPHTTTTAAILQEPHPSTREAPWSSLGQQLCACTHGRFWHSILPYTPHHYWPWWWRKWQCDWQRAVASAGEYSAERLLRRDASWGALQGQCTRLAGQTV